MSRPRLGIPAHVAFAYPPGNGRDLEPRRVEHFQFGITWDVTAILDSWARFGRAEDTLGKAILIGWWLLRVCGPLPGRPAERGEFTMEVSVHGHPSGWWITVET